MFPQSKPQQLHALKTWPIVFDALLTRAKTFEVRLNDRDYTVGDMLYLREWNPDNGKYTGRTMKAMVTYTLEGGCFGIMDGYICMSIRRLP